MNGDLPVGAPVMATMRGPLFNSVLIGLIEATGQTVPGLGSGAYAVRTEDGIAMFCAPYALFDLRPFIGRPAILICREAGNA